MTRTPTYLPTLGLRPAVLLIGLAAALFGGAVALPARAAHAAEAAETDLMSPLERRQLELSAYKVRNRNAGYFDVAARRAYLRRTKDPVLGAEVEGLKQGMSCRQVKALPIMNDRMEMPPFYRIPVDWRATAKPFFAFEEAMSRLAGHFVVTGERYYADCIIDVLRNWGEAGALLDIASDPDLPQAWFAAEASLFAAGFAFSIVRPYGVENRPEDVAEITKWLRLASHRHISVRRKSDSCCNNHFYRRALHATVIGIVTGDDELFQYGISAVYSALSEMNGDGSFPREMRRGPRAVHYQNYALLYLINIVQLAGRQGYNLFDLKVDGATLHKAINYTVEVILDPDKVKEHTDSEQQLRFLTDDQYFAWMEIYLAHFEAPVIEEFVRVRRPTFNRSAGGYATLYFYAGQDGAVTPRLELIGDKYVTRLKSCSRDPKWYAERDTAWRIACERRMRGSRADIESNRN